MVNQEIKALTKVIASLSPGYLRVIVGFSYNHVNGGLVTDIKSNKIPADLRRPNSEFILVLDKLDKEVIRVESII